jgi:hypothetical protein
MGKSFRGLRKNIFSCFQLGVFTMTMETMKMSDGDAVVLE